MGLTVVVVAVIVAVVVRRFIGEPLNARDLFLPPVVLVGIAVWGLVGDVHPNGRDVAWIVGAALAGLVFGALRGLTPRLFVKNGHLWQRYTVWTVVVWALSAAANAGIGFLAVAAGTPGEARPVTLAIGVSLLGEAITLGRRALATKVPFAPRSAAEFR